MTDQPTPGPKSGPELSRRTFIKSTSGGAAAIVAAASTVSTAKANPVSTPEQDQFLLDRITFGRSPQMAAEIATRGYSCFLDWQLGGFGQMPVLDDSNLFKDDVDFPPNGGLAWQDSAQITHAWRLSPFEILTDQTYPDPHPNNVILQHTYPAPQGPAMTVHAPHCLMMGGEYGEHQLRWILTDFFQNVHNTLLPMPGNYLFWAPFVRQSIYPYVLGNYKSLCHSSAAGASMILYLGQNSSTALEPNENYARELAELHTVGVRDYTVLGTVFPTFNEGDIDDLSRILTGVDSVGSDWFQLPVPMGTPLPNANFGNFQWSAGKHDNGPSPKTVSMTGGTFPVYVPKDYPNAGGLGAGLGEPIELIQDLVAHPACALHISRRLVQWFLGDDFEGQFQGPWIRTAAAFLTSGGEIRAAIRELFNLNFWHELKPSNTRDLKVRRPVNKVVAFKRALSATIDYNNIGNNWQKQQLAMGQVPGWWPAPNGYQPENEKWTGTMIPMVQFYYDAVWGGVGANVGNGLRIPDSTFATIFPSTAPINTYGTLAADAIAGGQIDAAEVAAINGMMNPGGNAIEQQRWALFYTLCSPSYQFLS